MRREAARREGSTSDLLSPVTAGNRNVPDLMRKVLRVSFSSCMRFDDEAPLPHRLEDIDPAGCRQILVNNIPEAMYRRDGRIVPLLLGRQQSD